MPVPEIDSHEFRRACGQFATGVMVITTRCVGDGDHGMTANAFMSISLDPPLIAISVAEKAKMLGRIRKASRFAVSILSRPMESIAWHFSGKMKHHLPEVFEECDGLPVIRNALAAFTADVAEEILAGDHTIFLGRVSSLIQGSEHEPLIFNRGHFAVLAECCNHAHTPSTLLAPASDLPQPQQK
jgi:flavin reductase (DIM6/NTAB) family NADH-FMN oxidoreductase RutF